MNTSIESQLHNILSQYKDSFSEKVYGDENNDYDVLMDVFGITPELKRENRQYWGTELGRCWESLVCTLFELTAEDYEPGLKIGDESPCDCILGRDAIDAKYRCGSGDAKTLKKFKKNGIDLTQLKYNPIVLILRDDNLPAAMSAFKSGEWRILTGIKYF